MEKEILKIAIDGLNREKEILTQKMPHLNASSQVRMNWRLREIDVEVRHLLSQEKPLPPLD